MQGAEAQVAQLSGECEQLERELEQLRQHCSLTEGETRRRGRDYQELQHSVETLQRNLTEKHQTELAVREELSRVKCLNEDLCQEKRLVEDRLENSKLVSTEARGKVKDIEGQMSDLGRRLDEAECGRKEAEERLAQAGCNVGADNYLKDELSKARKEKITLTEKLKQLEKNVKHLKTEKTEKTEILKNYSSLDQSSERIVRSQFPLASGRGGEAVQECGEHLVRIRLLEQEVERHLRRVTGLEQQLQELEHQHAARLQQLLQERKVERERDHTRHSGSLKQLEHSLNSRERMYKERIAGLEEQVHLLRDQISKEAKSRRSYLSSSQQLHNDVSDLRRQLDQSLEAVQNSSRAGLEGGLLEREAARLEQTIARQGREVVSRLTPSRRGRSSSADSIGLPLTSSTPGPASAPGPGPGPGPALRPPLLRRGLASEFERLAGNTSG